MSTTTGARVEKVYVALGNDLRDGFKTLDWTIRKWKSSPISIVILHVTYNISKDFVYTPFGKLPASSVSDEKLQVLEKYEQEKMDNLLSKYIAFCGKVKAEILKVEKADEPMHKFIVDLITRYRMTKLVMGVTFLKSSSWRSKSTTSGSFYIHQQKPAFCEFFIICGGRLVILKGNDEDETMEDDQGVIIARRANFITCFGKMFTDNSNNHLRSSRNIDSANSRNRWEIYVQEIEDYSQHLLSLNLEEEICEEENDALTLKTSLMEADMPEQADSTKSAAARVEFMRSKTAEVEKIIESKREEANANAERCAKAEWAISLCNARVEELEAKIKEEVTNRIEKKRMLDAAKEQIQEIASDVEENKKRLGSILEVQKELSNKLQTSTLARSNAEAQLEKAVIARAEMVREIEGLRRQRDVLQRRIEFCKEKDAIGMVARSDKVTYGYREYSSEDIRLATDDFSESLRLKSGGEWTNVYKGRLLHATVAIKMLNDDDASLSGEAFLAKVKFLNDIRHPHLVGIMGFCSELKCIVYEYMHNGSLRDILVSSQRTHRKRNRVLRWHDRIRVAHEVCLGLGFLHSAQPRPLVHGRLSASKILIDRNLAARISGFGITRSDVRADIQAFGVLLLHLLAGRNWARLVEEAMTMDPTALVRVLDQTAGQWPLNFAEQVFGIAMRCSSSNSNSNSDGHADLSLAKTTEELGEIRKNADDLVAKGGGCEPVPAGDRGVEEEQQSNEVPSIFLCPIFQDVMKNPHVAADGFSYELEAIEEWLGMGRETSPMTNLRLKHRFLTPNHTLRSLIVEWQKKHCTLPS